MNEVLERLGRQIRMIREQEKLTQKDVAEKADISLRTYVSIETGTGNPTLTNIIAIGSALGYPFDISFSRKK